MLEQPVAGLLNASVESLFEIMLAACCTLTCSQLLKTATRLRLAAIHAMTTKVLFCGEEFPGAFEFTCEATEGMSDVEVLKCRRQDLARHIGDVQVAVPMMSRLDADMLRQGKQLKLVLQFGVGVEGIDISAATELGIWVSNIPSEATGNALSCAEMVIYLMFALLRNTNEMQTSIKQQRLGSPAGQTLYGKTVLVIGFGNIAKELIPRLKPFGVRVTAVRRSAWQGEHPAEALLDHQGGWEDLPSLAVNADIVVLACVMSELTRGMVNSAFLAACKPGVHIVNVARGGLLDYDAVAEGLQDGRIGGLGLDVQWSEPWNPADPMTSHARVVMTPHVAGVTELSYRNMGKVVAHEVAKMLMGQPPTVQLNSISIKRALAKQSISL